MSSGMLIMISGLLIIFGAYLKGTPGLIAFLAAAACGLVVLYRIFAG